jgi:hypothetical protein
MGSSRPAGEFKLFDLKIKLYLITETGPTSLFHSFQPLIRGQVIMLPLHSQNTAAVKIITGQAVPTKIAAGGVFGKQAGGVFAEFVSNTWLLSLNRRQIY